MYVAFEDYLDNIAALEKSLNDDVIVLAFIIVELRIWGVLLFSPSLQHFHIRVAIGQHDSIIGQRGRISIEKFQQWVSWQSRIPFILLFNFPFMISREFELAELTRLTIISRTPVSGNLLNSIISLPMIHFMVVTCILAYNHTFHSLAASCYIWHNL